MDKLSSFSSIIFVFIFMFIVFGGNSAIAFIEDDSYQEYDEQIYYLQSKSHDLLMEIRHSIKKQDISSEQGKKNLLAQLLNFNEQIKKLQSKQSELSFALDEEDPNKAEYKRLTKVLVTEKKYLEKIKTILSRINTALAHAAGVKRFVRVNGELEAGVGFSGTKNNTTNERDVLYNGRTNTEVFFSDNLKSIIKVAHGRNFAITPFTTTDVSATVDWNKDRLQIRPSIGFHSYDDLNNDTLAYDTFQFGVEENYKSTTGRWSFRASQKLRENSYNINTSNFSTLTLRNSAKKRLKKGSINIDLNYLKRSNEINKDQDFNQISPSIKWVKKINVLKSREIYARTEINSYENSPASDSLRLNLHMLYDTSTNGGGSLTYGPTLTWLNFPDNDEASYVEPGFQTVERKYSYEKGSTTSNKRYYYHYAVGSHADFLKFDSQKTCAGKPFWEKYRFVDSTQSNLKLFLVDSDPYDGEQSWFYYWRPKLSFQQKSFDMSVGPILGHNMFLNFADYKRADDLKKSGVSDEDPIKVFLENASNSLQYGVSFAIRKALNGIFVSNRQSLMGFSSEYSRQVSYFARPKGIATALVFNLNFTTPISRDLELALDVNYSQSNSKTENTSGDPLDRYHALLSLKVPFLYAFGG